MKKLVHGVVNFHEQVLPSRRADFAQLAQGQAPDVLMIACSDSRVAPNVFASTDPGDLFVVRNPGNLVPPLTAAVRGSSEAAAIELALTTLPVNDVIVCGHSGCAGMAALQHTAQCSPHLRDWMAHGQAAHRHLEHGPVYDAALSAQDQLSQHNVLTQLDHLRTYPEVEARVTARTLRLHGWWFNIGEGTVYAFEPDAQQFVVIDAAEGERILARMA